MSRKKSVKETVRKRKDDLRPEYDFAKMKGGVRGKYVEQLWDAEIERRIKQEE
jgi:hypothetical protein